MQAAHPEEGRRCGRCEYILARINCLKPSHPVLWLSNRPTLSSDTPSIIPKLGNCGPKLDLKMQSNIYGLALLSHCQLETTNVEKKFHLYCRPPQSLPSVCWNRRSFSLLISAFRNFRVSSRSLCVEKGWDCLVLGVNLIHWAIAIVNEYSSHGNQTVQYGQTVRDCLGRSS